MAASAALFHEPGRYRPMRGRGIFIRCGGPPGRPSCHGPRHQDRLGGPHQCRPAPPGSGPSAVNGPVFSRRHLRGRSDLVRTIVYRKPPRAAPPGDRRYGPSQAAYKRGPPHLPPSGRAPPSSGAAKGQLYVSRAGAIFFTGLGLIAGPSPLCCSSGGDDRYECWLAGQGCKRRLRPLIMPPRPPRYMCAARIRPGSRLLAGRGKTLPPPTGGRGGSDRGESLDREYVRANRAFPAPRRRLPGPVSAASGSPGHRPRLPSAAGTHEVALG